jgi:hypothetical protein
MKFTVIIHLLFITNFCFAITYTTTGVNTWDANGAPPAGWLTADIVINHSITSTLQLQPFNNCTVTINNGGTWNIQDLTTAGATPTITVNSGGKLTTSGPITISGANIIVNTGGRFEIGGSATFNSGSITVGGTITIAGNTSRAADVTFPITCTGVFTYNGSWSGNPPSCPLPVEIIKFHGQKESDNIHLKWTTATETNSNHFEITRSNDDKNFLTIGIVNASGNSTTIENYTFIDINPLLGKNYYQLKEVDNDQQSFKSNIIVFDFDQNSMQNALVIPNPLTKESVVAFNVIVGDEFYILISDTQGKTIYQTSKYYKPGINEFPLYDFVTSKGLYHISLKSNEQQPENIAFIKAE